MISSLRGRVLSSTGTTAVIDVGGVGFAVTVTPDHAASLRVGAEAELVTTLIVREDDMSLFGFSEQERLRVFDLLRSVTGVGPKSAMGVLSVMSPDEIARAVEADDDGAFRKVPGIGPKTSKLIIVSLAGKVHAVEPATAVAASTTTSDVVTALVGLGWTEKAASEAAENAASAVTADDRDNVAAMIRVALASLSTASKSMRGAGTR